MERRKWEALSVRKKNGKMPKELDTEMDDGICRNVKVNLSLILQYLQSLC